MKAYLFASLALIAAGPLAAQAAAPADSGPKPITRLSYTEKVDASFARVDANKDGNLSLAEIAALEVRNKAAVEAQLTVRRKQMFDKIDTDKNGQLSFAEFAAGMTQPKLATDGKAALAELDSNKDGKVTQAEFRAPAMVKFDKLDANKDGIVSVEEQRKAAASGR